LGERQTADKKRTREKREEMEKSEGRREERVIVILINGSVLHKKSTWRAVTKQIEIAEQQAQ
jgi:hypothetical protein